MTNKTRNIVLAIGIFILGGAIGSAGCEEGCKEPVKVGTQIEYRDCDDSLWRELKSIDDRGFGVAKRSMGIMSDGLTAAANRDVAGMEIVADALTAENEIMGGLVTERWEVLSKLGY